MHRFKRKKSKSPKIILFLTGITVCLAGFLLFQNFQFTNASISDVTQSDVTPTAENRISLPTRNLSIPNFNVESEAGISVFMDNNGNKRILYQKNIDKPLLIASITKLMTAVIALKNYNMSQTATIDRKGLRQAGVLNLGDTFTVDTLFHIILTASDNTAAYTLSEIMGSQKFVGLMNLEAKEYGLTNTYYVNSVGSGLGNHSTARDLSNLAFKLVQNHPEILKISTIPAYDIYNVKHTFHYKPTNPNKLLFEQSNWQDKIIGGKMGENNVAGGCLLLVLKAPNDNGYIANVILNSKLRFTEMNELIAWEQTAYNW